MWSTRHISFDGRTLVNAVLWNICVYWSQIFLLPNAALNQINAICRSFLWTSKCNNSRPRYASWEDTCERRSHGGLGFRSLIHWNVAIVGKQVWPIALKADYLWMKWSHDRYIRDQSWSNFCTP